uniref:EB domain-containing protein n=1 Tax=Globodera rostochiensis TaxID=31243 RepID=A0A914GVQ5_GLORO
MPIYFQQIKYALMTRQSMKCDLITCPAGTTCGIFNGIASLGNEPFEPFQFPKCVSNPLDLSRNTEQNGNVQNIVNGPGCNCGMTQCAVGFQCQVESSIVKLGSRPFAQIIGGSPQCVANGGSLQNPLTVISGGPGCDQLPACLAGTTCVTASGIAKYGNLQSAQFFWPFCA